VAYEPPDWVAPIAKHFAEGWPPYVSCQDGWKNIILDLVKNLNTLGIKWEVHQIKEKFGGLCFYADPIDGMASEYQTKVSNPEYIPTADDEKLLKADIQDLYKQFHKLIGEAEAKAAKTCEFCGEPGVIRNDRSWIQTLCDLCAASRG
jgi:hypothetical protein